MFITIRNNDFNVFFLQYLPIPDTMKNIPGRMSSAENQYIFQVSLPALGFNTYYFEATGNRENKLFHLYFNTHKLS